jgi:DNA mismatch repair protein MutS2
MPSVNPEPLYDPSHHAASILDLEDVLEIIAGTCLNEGARSLITSIRPSADPAWIASSIAAIEDMRNVFATSGDLPLPATANVRAVKDAARLETAISGPDLVGISNQEKAVLRLKKRFLKDPPEFFSVEGIIRGLAPHGELVDAVDRAVGEDGNVLDRASPLLARIRKSMAATRERLRREAEKHAERYGENAYATVLDGRFKLLIPRDRYRKRDGIIHSKSHSGGSLYFEPIQLVETNNEMETLVHDEKSEEARILRELSGRVAESADEIIRNSEDIEILDALQAKARFSSRFNCVTPRLSVVPVVRLLQARHPVLELSLSHAVPDSPAAASPASPAGPPARTIVPLDLQLLDQSPILVITGPNAGGKTVALKTLGIVVLMHQCGLQVPCTEGTELGVFKKIFADIGDEQSMSTSLSTFTSHLHHLDSMCRQAGRESLCLIDEIGDGTDPDEGAALANATLDALLDRGAMVVATTHYGKVKIHAMTTTGLGNASMLFDDETQEPLYTLLQGIAGRSRGLDTAHRCGFDAAILERAGHYLGDEAYQLEMLLSELERSHQAIEKERDSLRRQSEELERATRLYGEREQALKEIQEKYSEDARKHTEELLLNARKEIERIVKNIRESGARKREIKEGHERIREMMENVRRPQPERTATPAGADAALEPGDSVSLNESGSPAGTLIELQNGVATIEINGKRIKIHIDSLYKVSRERAEPQRTGFDIEYEPLESTSIDVRGREREEALEAVDRFIDTAILSGVHEVMVIHGVGEGILSRAIHEQLQADPRVASFRSGMSNEGGEGVSFIVLA